MIGSIHKTTKLTNHKKLNKIPAQNRKDIRSLTKTFTQIKELKNSVFRFPSQNPNRQIFHKNSNFLKRWKIKTLENHTPEYNLIQKA
jgi:hypothetical protein